jgi:hypothetical protein
VHNGSFLLNADSAQENKLYIEKDICATSFDGAEEIAIHTGTSPLERAIYITL